MMSDLQARLALAIQSIRTSTPRKCDECYTGGVFWPARHTDACEARWAAKVDARLAACVEAAVAEGYEQGVYEGWNNRDADVDHQVLAAFLAAAAQKETTK